MSEIILGVDIGRAESALIAVAGMLREKCL
jgi:hypothetical protein